MQKKPLKNERLKIIDYLGTYYGTVDGENLFEIDKGAYYVLQMLDGTKTVEEIAEHIANAINMDVETVMPTLKRMLEEMEKLNFIKMV